MITYTYHNISHINDKLKENFTLTGCCIVVTVTDSATNINFKHIWSLLNLSFVISSSAGVLKFYAAGYGKHL